MKMFASYDGTAFDCDERIVGNQMATSAKSYGTY